MKLHELPPEERRRRGTALCSRLASDVAALTPPGIGAWSKTWDIVAGADTAFLIALTGWEAAPSEALRLQVRGAYNAVLEAWRTAAAEYLANRGSAR